MPDIAIAHHEWMALCHLVHAIDPSESDPAEGVALMRRQGRRWWTVWDRGAAVHTTAVPDTERPRPEHEVTLVSPRVVYHAVAMGGSADPVHLRLDDGSVGLSGQRGALTVTRPVERPVASDRRVTAVESTATVPAGDLRAVLAGAVYRPRGVVADRTGPWLSLEVAEGRLWASAMLVDGIEDRADVLAEVNALTGALPGTRVWFDSGVVFAGFDLPGSAVEEHLAPMLVNLGRRVDGLRPRLAALGARQPTNYDQGVLF